ncbi:fumarylacetoacetate hydrolase family protein [Mycolicibacterium canariasense]|uniref:fumarylacetoacetate hydrolase family protein n=1 Tax=Mycolicibacterium canariasense TaxID=228230 RepID=UPI000786837A|nr:fumarylacetoacetate hydrolase family protein [Mycolicibacterium canariasense]MCV7208137.1 fumarylacetoacetate hydrolase family protein [Mycolicibacterium canariasense]ORV09519.1 fumarylacetoacetase [Mycolicibacterium canariasense]
MKLRRVRAGGALELQTQDTGGAWQTTDDDTPLGGRVFDKDWELARADEHLRHGSTLLPFQPVSFRDFMLYEQHVLDASRGLVRRFHPGQYRLVTTVEALTRRTFPLLKPKPLFYAQPMYYMSNAMTFVPSGTPIAAPSYTRALDYELEIGFVLARGLFNATPAEALDAIGAFVVLNDLSARDVQRAEMDSGFGPQKAKHFANSLSEVAVTADEILPRIDTLRGAVSINGSTVSTVSSAGMQHGLGEVLAHASRSEHLLPGELFGTGTLPGGSGMETGHWLRPGDTLELSIDGIGSIEHTIVDS